jgi:hypothetical protein
MAGLKLVNAKSAKEYEKDEIKGSMKLFRVFSAFLRFSRYLGCDLVS